MQKGSELEKLARKENNQLRLSGNALIIKFPVPIELTPKGLIARKSTVDFVGTLKGGLSIDYDAKETLSKTSFPLSNIKEHQINYLYIKYNLGGIAFFMIHFKKVYKDEVFITPVTFIRKYWIDALDNDGRKSIPLKDFNTKWLTTIDNYINKVEELKNELRRNSI